MVGFLSLFFFKKWQNANNQLYFKKCHKNAWNWIFFSRSCLNFMDYALRAIIISFHQNYFAKQGGEQFKLKISSFCGFVCFFVQNLLNGSSFCILGKLMNSRTFDEFGSLLLSFPALPFLPIVLCKRNFLKCLP